MRSKLFGRLMSFTLSATVALTSGIPALAYDGGGGDLPEEDVELLEEEVVEEDLEETGAISDAEEIVLDEEVEEDVSFAEDENEEEEAEFEALNDLTVSFVTTSTDLDVYDMNDTDYSAYALASPIATAGVDATMSYSFLVKPDPGYVLPSTLINATIGDYDTLNKIYPGTHYLNYGEIEATGTAAWSDKPAAVEVKKVTSESAVGYTVSDFGPNNKYKVITLNKSLLEDVLAKYVDKNGKWAGRETTDFTKVKKAERPVLKLVFNAAEQETYVVNQPTAKGGATAVEVIEERRSLTTKAYDNTETESTWSKIVGIDLEGTDYDIDDATITIKLSKNGNAIDDTPISWAAPNDVTLKAETTVTHADDVTEGALDMPSDGQAVWDENDGILYIFQGLVNAAYTNGWTMDIEVDVTQVPVAKNAISVADTTYAKVFKSDGTTPMPSEYEKATGIALTVKGLADNDGVPRRVEKVEYSANGAGKVKLGVSANTTVSIPDTATKGLEGPVVLYVTTSESVTGAITETRNGNVEASTNAVILAEDGSVASRAISGMPYKFAIRTMPGYKVGKVSYQIGGETKSTDLKPDADGIYKTVNVTDNLEIAVEVVAGNTPYDVTRTTVANSNVAIHDENRYQIYQDLLSDGDDGTNPPNDYHSNIIETATVGSPATDYYGYQVATHNRQYYFRAIPDSTYMVTGVKYTMGTSTTEYDAVLVSGDPSNYTTGAVYRTGLVTGNVVLKPVVNRFVTLSACSNNFATITYNGKELTSTAVPVQSGKDVIINVAPKDSSYKITKVYDGSTEFGKTAGTYTLNLSANTQIHVDTEQTADASKYSVVFKNKPGTNEETGTKETDQLKNTYDAKGNLISQSLTIEVGETAKLGENESKTAVVFKDGVTPSIDSGVTLELSKVHSSDKVATVASEDVTGYKAGTDTITATIRKTSNHNTVVYTGELPLTVVDAYKDLHIDASATAIMAGPSPAVPATISVKGTNGRTGDEVVIQANDSDKNIGKIVFAFEPDISTVTSLEYGFGAYGTLAPSATITTSDAETTVAVAKAQNKPIKVVATIYEYNNTDVYATLTKEFTTVDFTKYYVVPSLALADGMAYTLGDTNAPTTFSLDVSGNKKTAEVTLDVYERIDDTYLATPSTLAAIKDAENKGFIKKVDQSKISYKTSVSYSLDTNGKRPVDYVTVSGSAGKFTVTGAKKTASSEYETVTIIPSINGISLTPVASKFEVTEKIANTEVTFTTAAPKFSGIATKAYEDKDGEPVTSPLDAAVIINSLKTDYLTGYERSIVEDSTREYEEGVLYRVETGSVITLPTENDFVASTRDKRAVLVGWLLTNTSDPDDQVRAINGAIVDADDDSNYDIAFAPGTKLAIKDDVGFTAVWAPRYIVNSATINNGQIKMPKADDEATEAAQALDPSALTVMMDAYDTQITSIAKGVTLPAVIRAKRAYKIDPDTGTPVTQDVYISSGFTLAYAEGTTTSQQSAVTLSGTNLTAKAIANANEIGLIEATITDSAGGTWVVNSDAAEDGTPDISVAKETTRTVAFAKWDTTPTLNSDFTGLDDTSKLAKLTLEKSEAAAEYAVWPVVFESGKSGSLISDLDTGYQIDYSIDKSNIVKYINSADSGTTLGMNDSFMLDVTPLAIGTANLTVTITDAVGNKAVGVLPIEVTEDKVEIQFTDKDKNTITSVQAIGNNGSGSTEGVGEIYVKAVRKEDATTLTGTWDITNQEGTTTSEIVDGMIGAALDAGDGSGRKILRVDTSGSILGTDDKNVYVTFDTGTKIYRKQITVTTFFNIVLKGDAWYDSDAYVTTTADHTQPEVDYLFVLADGVRQKDAKKTAALEEDYPALETRIKVTAADQVITRTNAGAVATQKITIDLSKYTAEMVKNKKVVTKGEFKQWFLDNGTGSGTANDFDKDADEVGIGKTTVKNLTTASFVNGQYVLTPQMGATTISGVVPSVASISLVNEKDKNYANVTLTLTPENTTDEVAIFADNFGFFAIEEDPAATVTAYPNIAPAEFDDDMARDGVALANTNGTSKFVAYWLANKAGKTNLKFYSVGDLTANTVDPNGTPGDADDYIDWSKTKLLATIPLRIDGLSVEADGKYYIEDGEKLKGVARTIGEDTFVFGDDGKQITGSKVYKLADGTSILIRGDKATTEGVWTIDADTYVTDENGIILSGWQTYGGNKYYADPADGNKAVDGFQEIDGKYYYFRSHALVTASASANTYELISGTNYYVNAAGEVAVGGIFAVAGVNRLFREDGTIVKHNDSDVVNGKIKVGGIGYIIHDDDSAEFDDILYNATVIWSDSFESTYTKGTGLPILKYTISYTSKNTGKTEKTEALYAVVTCDGDYSDTSVATQLTFKATASLDGYWKDANATTPAIAATKEVTYKFKDGGLIGTSGQDISNGGTIYAEGLEDEYYYTGVAIKPVVTVTDDGKPLAQGVDYTVKYTNNTKISPKNSDGEYTASAQIIIKGKGNYDGQGQTLSFAIIDPKDAVEEDDVDLTGYKITLPKEDLFYTGEAVYPSSITLTPKGGTAVTYEHQGNGDYGDLPAVVTFANNVNKGSARLLLTGKPNAKGTTKTLNKKFTIKAVNMEANAKDFTVSTEKSEVEWAVNGAKPEVTVAWAGHDDLILGQDFTVSYKYGKNKIGAATVTVKGKGNFAKSLKQTFTIVALPLDDEMIAAVSAFDKTKGAKVTLLDSNGDVIPAKKYTVSVFDGETDVTKAKLVGGTQYTVVIKAASAELTSDDDGISTSVTAGFKLSSAKVDAKSIVKTYSGDPITLDEEDIAKLVVTYKKAPLVYGEDYIITGYKNNIKKGNMTVTIAGVGKYSGPKTFKVKIAPKPITK